jgi:quinol monooxygenase YgiN
MTMAYVVSAKWRAKEGKEERLLEVIREMTAPSRAEPGNVFYQAQRSVEDPRLFYLYEQYVDVSGYEAHMASEHFTRLVKQEAIPELLEGRERAFYETIDDAAGGLTDI